jgi:dynamin GTPase
VGDQPSNISEAIRDLVRSYISKDNTLILAVTPATVDVETSEAIAMAHEVDPHGVRTLGVITKPDCREKGAEMKRLIEVLENKVVVLKKGYVAIKNRSQNQSDSNVSAEESVRDEENFFRSNPAFDAIKERTGSRYLLRVLCKELGQKIKERLPEFNNELTRQLFGIDQVKGESAAPATVQ